WTTAGVHLWNGLSKRYLHLHGASRDETRCGVVELCVTITDTYTDGYAHTSSANAHTDGYAYTGATNAHTSSANTHTGATNAYTNTHAITTDTPTLLPSPQSQ